MPRDPVPDLAGLTFPARDERFDTLISRLSEPTDSPAGDNFVSNEDSYPRVAGELTRRAVAGSVYLGVGPDQNFTYIARARPCLSFVIDFRRRNLLLHLLHKGLITLARDRAEYLSLLTARGPGPLAADSSAADLVTAFTRAKFDRSLLEDASRRVADVVRPLNVLTPDEWREFTGIQARLAGPGMTARFLALPMYPTFSRLMTTPDRDGRPAHWLSSEADYQSVRAAQSGDRIIPLTADFAGPTTFARLGDWLRRRGFKVGTFYTSDVEFFLLRSGRFEPYLANLARLPWADGVVLVRTSTREIDHPARVRGDSSTTVVIDVRRFLSDANAGRVRTPDDLFSPERRP